MTESTLPPFARLFRVSLLLTALLLAGCGAVHTKTVDSWKSDEPVARKPAKVAVIAALPDALMREAVEVDVAKILADKGTPAVASSRMAGMSGGIRGEIDGEAAATLLRQAGAEGVVVMFYAGGSSDREYVRADYWAEYQGTGVGYGWARPYFVDVYSVNRGADIVNFQSDVLVESSYYDLATEQPVWRMVTEVKDVEHTDAARDIARKIASEMRSTGLN